MWTGIRSYTPARGYPGDGLYRGLVNSHVCLSVFEMQWC
jgi:hypothetical protein